MTNLVIPEPQKTLIPLKWSDKHFPVRRVYCIGRNYAAHTIEMGFSLIKSHRSFFKKILIILIFQVSFLIPQSPATFTMNLN